MTISDVIDAKNRILAKYETPEYIESQLGLGITPFQLSIYKVDREIVLHELIVELSDIVIRDKTATTPDNIED